MTDESLPSHEQELKGRDIEEITSGSVVPTGDAMFEEEVEEEVSEEPLDVEEPPEVSIQEQMPSIENEPEEETTPSMFHKNRSLR